MAKTDVVLINVLADEAPTITASRFLILYENQTYTDRLELAVNSGSPRANSLSAAFYNNQSFVSVITPSPALTLTWDNALLPSQEDADATIPVTIQTPDLSGNAPKYYYVRFTYAGSGYESSRNLSAQADVIILVLQSIPSAIDIPNSFIVSENENISLDYYFDVGSPATTEIRHSWHQSLTDARNDTNEATNRPDVTNSWTPDRLYREAPIGGEDVVGYLTMRTPAVTQEQRFYGRLEIIQEGNVVGFDTYTLVIRNSIVPSISVGNHVGIEGETIIVPVMYMGGQPRPERWDFNIANARARAEGENWLDADDPRRPTAIDYYQHATPRQGPTQRTMNMRVTLPYVDRNETLWCRLSIVATDPITNTPHYTHAYFRLVIQNRVEAGIEFPDMSTLREMTTDHEIEGVYWRGVPPATSMDATVHADTADATGDTRPLTGDGEPSVRLSVTTPDMSGGPTDRKPITLYFTAPDEQMDEDYGVRVDIIQAPITPDPS